MIVVYFLIATLALVLIGAGMLANDSEYAPIPFILALLSAVVALSIIINI